MAANHLIDSARSHRARIVGLRVIHLDDLTQTQIPVTPAALSTWASVNHHHSNDPKKLVDESLARVASARPVAFDSPLEVRWKLSFVDTHGTSLLDIYHESHEAYGYADTERVRFEHDGIVTFLQERFGVHERTLKSL